MLSKLQTHLLIVPMSNLKWSSAIGHSSKLLAWRKSTNKRKQKQKARAITIIQSGSWGELLALFLLYYCSKFLHFPSSPYCSLLLPSLSATIFSAFPVSVYWKPSNPCPTIPSLRDHLYSVLPCPLPLPGLSTLHIGLKSRLFLSNLAA